MKVSDAIIAVGSLISGAKILSDGLSEIGEAAKKARVAFRGSGTEPVATVYKIGNDIAERVYHIKAMSRKGMIDPRVRAFALRAVSSRCARCANCKTVNVLTSASRGKAVAQNSVRANIIGDDAWSCGKCERKNPISTTTWCVPEKNWRAECEAVFNVVREHVRYARDPSGVDTFQHPARTLEWGGGDCDDYTIVLVSMLKTLGYDPKMRVVETKDPKNGKRAGGWTHILCMVPLPPNKPSAYLPLDASMAMPAGWYPPKAMIYKTRDFSV